MSDKTDGMGYEASTEESLTFGDKINWPFIIASGMLGYLRASTLPHEVFDPDQVKRTSMAVLSVIPSSDRDKEFNEAYEKAKITRDIDNRPRWCEKPIGQKTPENQSKVVDYDPYLLMTATVDLLKRLGLLSKIISIERRMNRKPPEMVKSGV